MILLWIIYVSNNNMNFMEEYFDKPKYYNKLCHNLSQWVIYSCKIFIFEPIKSVW